MTTCSRASRAASRSSSRYHYLVSCTERRPIPERCKWSRIGNLSSACLAAARACQLWNAPSSRPPPSAPARRSYAMHHDCNGLLRRYATVLFYLNDVDEDGGGETVFPAAGDDGQEWSEHCTVDDAIRRFSSPELARSLNENFSSGSTSGEAVLHSVGSATAPGIRVTPKQGDAVVWYNFDAEGRLDPRAVHAAQPVTSGEKWVANFWCSITPEELLAIPT
jgi:hypothetical protein